MDRHGALEHIGGRSRIHDVQHAVDGFVAARLRRSGSWQGHHDQARGAERNRVLDEGCGAVAAKCGGEPRAKRAPAKRANHGTSADQTSAPPSASAAE